MRFGAFFLLGSPDMLPSDHMYSRLMRWVTQAEELGYDSVWFAEHHFSNYGYIPNPLMMAVKVACETSRVRIGTAVLVLPFWDPLRAAEDIAMADQLTGGRMEIGVARGYQPYEFARFGVPFEEARERTDETLEVMLHALTEQGFEYHGAHHRIPETTIFPRPLQQPRPPVWLAAHTRESFDIAVRLGLKAITTNSGRPLSVLKQSWATYLEARAAAGLGEPEEFAVQQQFYVGSSDEEARGQVDNALYAFRQVNNLRSGHEQVVKGYSTPNPIEGEPTLAELFESRVLFGSPDTVARKIAEYQEVCGMTSLNCTFQLGRMDEETVAGSMRLFAKEVMPRFL